MQVVVKGKLLDLENREYEFEGKKGITHKIVVYSEGQLYKVTVDEKMLDAWASQIGDEVEVNCNLFIKGTYNLKEVQ